LIILADAEREYIDAMVEQLSVDLPDEQMMGCSNLDEWPAAIQSHYNLCVFNPVDFPDLPQKCGSQDASASWTFWSIRPGLPDVSGSYGIEPGEALFRLSPASKLIPRLKRWLDVHHEMDMANQEANSCASRQNPIHLLTSTIRNSTAGTPENNQFDPACGIYLHLSVGISGYRPEVIRLRLLEMTGQGSKVIYLPVMPTYQMACLSQPGQGPALSDLLLQLLGRNIEPGHLGPYLQPHPDGYLQFRPPERSDDLVLCSPDILRQLVLILRKKISAEHDACSVLIDCTGIPLASVSAMAVLCDGCEISLPDGDSFAAQAARREVGSLLALLPPGCRVKENGQLKSQPEGKLKAGK
jgi:hypothetical protein